MRQTVCAKVLFDSKDNILTLKKIKYLTVFLRHCNQLCYNHLYVTWSVFKDVYITAKLFHRLLEPLRQSIVDFRNAALMSNFMWKHYPTFVEGAGCLKYSKYIMVIYIYNLIPDVCWDPQLFLNTCQTNFNHLPQWWCHKNRNEDFRI